MKSKLVLAVLFVLGGVGYGWWEYKEFDEIEVPLLKAERDLLQQTVKKKERDLEELKKFAEDIESVKRELRELNLQLEAALEHMPRSFNLSGLLRKLHLLAQNSGVELSTFKPVKGENRQGFYSAIAIDFDIKGSFTQFLVFFDQITRLKRIVNIETLKVSIRESGKVQASGLVAEASGQIRTYRFNE